MGTEVIVAVIIGASSVIGGVFAALATRFGVRMDYKQKHDSEAFDEIVALNETYRAEIIRLQAKLDKLEKRD